MKRGLTSWVTFAGFTDTVARGAAKQSEEVRCGSVRVRAREVTGENLFNQSPAAQFEACQVFPSLLCAGPCAEPQREPTAFDCAITQATVERLLASPRSKLLRLAFGGRGNEGGECGAVKNVVQREMPPSDTAIILHLGQTELWAWVTASRSDHTQHSSSSGLRVVPTCTRCSEAKDSQ
jgi:hypothetical protein